MNEQNALICEVTQGYSTRVKNPYVNYDRHLWHLCSYQLYPHPLPPLSGDSRGLSRVLISYFCDVQGTAPGTGRDCGGLFSCKSPGRALPHNPRHLGQNYIIYLTRWFNFVLRDVQGTARGRSQVCMDTIFCKSLGKFFLPSLVVLLLICEDLRTAVSSMLQYVGRNLIIT